MSSPANGPAGPIDFATLAHTLLGRAEQWLHEWLPGGRVEGHEYVGPSKAAGGIGDSLKVNLVNGRWAYFGGSEQDSGGDLISLYAWLHGVNNRQAALQLMDALGWRVPQQPEPARREAGRNAAPADRAAIARDIADAGDAAPAGEAAAQPEPAQAYKRRAERWRSVLPVPPHAPAPRRFVFAFHNRALDAWQELEAVRSWAYEFEGERFGYVCRFERFNSAGELVKDTLPYTWCEDQHDERRAQRWHWKQWATPRPLYVPATLLSGDPARVPVVIVEGEKCAEAGHQLLGHEFDFVSWPGGAKAWALARWTWLRGRTVFLWPDADAKRHRLSRAERDANVDPATKPLLPLPKQPGMAAMLGIGTLLLAEHGCTVHLCPMAAPGERPDGWDIADAIAEGWGPERVREHIRAATRFVAPDDAARAAAGASTPTNAPAGGGGRGAGSAATQGGGGGGDDGQPWRSYLMTSASTGAIKAVRENVVVALDGRPEKGVAGIAECAGLIRYNQFTNNVEKVREAPWGTAAGEWLECDELALGDWLVREHYMPSMGREALTEAVMVVAHRHAYHPLRQRVEGLRGKWDRVPRLDGWLRRVCLEDDEISEPLQRYLELAGRWFLMAMCARVMSERKHGARIVCGPGVKFDYMLIFEGPQGWGKSTLAAVLGGDYFADTGLDIQHKDSLMNIQGIWVYEWSELENLTKQEVGAVKRFISSPADRFRATFDRRPAKYPRQVVFVGTTNEAHYLTDTTGNRRFWPVRISRPPDLDYLREHLEQLLAEAVHRVDAGERFYPTRDEQARLFDAQQRERAVESALEQEIRSYLYDENRKTSMGEPNGSLVGQIGMSELLRRIGLPIDKQTDAVVKRAGALLHMLGWTVRRLSADEQGHRPRVYVRPTTEWKPPALPADSQHLPSGSEHSRAAGRSDRRNMDEVGDDAMPF